MCSAAGWFSFKSSPDDPDPRRLLVVSTHFYDKKSLNPEQFLLEWLAKERSTLEGLTNDGKNTTTVIWGGDLNRMYTRAKATEGGAVDQKKGKKGGYKVPTSPIPDGYFSLQGEPTNGSRFKKIDWIFASSDARLTRDLSNEKGTGGKGKGKKSSAERNPVIEFIEGTKRKTETTGYPPSDHVADACFVST